MLDFDRHHAIAALFDGLQTAPALLLAVSGGPDSMALMLLAVRWVATRPDPPALHVATVDHGLRAASRAEAEGVARAAAALGLKHTILPWIGPKPRTRIQEAARAARYALLADHAESVGATHLLTAHHADDQAETILLRLGRGSGIGGLAGMRRARSLRPSLILVRPLLGLAKTALVALCETAALPVVDDPSNYDPAYARVRLRAQAAAAAGLGLDPQNLLRLSARMARAEEALDAEARRRFAALDGRSEAGRFEARLAPLVDAKLEIVIRVLRFAVMRVATQTAPPRLDRLETLAEALVAALQANRTFRGTLHGTRVVLRRDTMLTIAPEAERRRGRKA